jgi:hypothetical protein
MVALAGIVLAAGLVLGGLPAIQPARAVDPPRMDARALLGGHARLGTWMAIEVALENDGPPIVGELRLAGGAQGRTRFGISVDLPTGSRKSYVLHVQPPSFGDRIEVALVVNGNPLATRKIAFTLHDPTQLLVGIVADQPGRLVGEINLATTQNALPPATVTLTAEDLPERVEAWAALDRLIWQDVDAARLNPDQLTALRGWLAGGGRLVIVGGTAGPAALTGFPDAILPYRPTATIEAPASALSALLGSIPAAAGEVTALAGASGPGRALATSGDRVIAAELGYGNGAVDLIGFDPTLPQIADSKAGEALWRGLVPPRGGGGPVVGGDDSQLVNAVATLPSLALPPIGGLIVLLFGYILLIGPVNYLVLRRLDRREWAWLTMPVLIVVFAFGSYGFGAALRGSEVLVNEVAIIRGAADTEEGLGTVYVGIFSPNRATYQVRVPGGALLSASITSEMGGGPDQGAGSLDLLQGDPSRIRDLAVGFGSLRTIRADAPATVPRLSADLRLENGRLVGTIRNGSDRLLQRVAIVLGGSLAVVGDISPGAGAKVDLIVRGDNTFGQSLSDRIIGPAFFGDPSMSGSDGQTAVVRHAIIDQLTYDPNFGTTGQLPADGPVLLGWADGDPLEIEIDGQQPRRTGQTLFYVPLRMAIHGPTVFSSDLVRSTVVANDASFFNKNPSPFDLSFGQGSVTLSYRPVAFSGTLAPTKLVLSMNAVPDAPVEATEIEPTGPPPEGPSAGPAAFDGLPEIDVFDLDAGAWLRLPHLTSGRTVAVRHPERYVDPATGTALIRLSNGRPDGIGFQFFVRIEGGVQ